MKKILFVCTGNTCRSPMAEMIMRRLLEERKITDIEVSSCGIAASEGEKMTNNAIEALKSMKIEDSGHCAKQFKENYFDEFNLILTMTKTQKEMLGDRKNVYTLAELTGVADIADPYGMSLENYRVTAQLLENACKILLDTIK